MKSTLFLFTLFCMALTARAASISTPSVQNVRFAQDTSPTDLLIPQKVLSHAVVVYTDEGCRRRIQGDVIVQVYFDEEGKATLLRVVKGLGYGLDASAVEALYWWRFSPALRNGLPVSVVAEIEVPFRFEVKHLEITADTETLVNGVVHFKGNVEMRITLNDGSVEFMKGDHITCSPDLIEMAGGAHVTIRTPH
jgi:TonB family protein